MGREKEGREEEYDEEQALDLQREEEQRPEPIDTPLELQQFLISPDAKTWFAWINKDMILSYLDEEDLEKVRLIGRLINTLERYSLRKVAKDFIGDLLIIVNTARARHGFERQIQNTTTMKEFSYYDGEEERRRSKMR